MNRKEQSSELKRRIARQREFLSRREPGDLLAFAGMGYHSLESFLCTRIYERGPDVVVRPAETESAVREYLTLLHVSLDRFYDTGGDCVPSCLVYWGIGSITAAMIGKDPVHDATTSWLEPNLSWPEIDGLVFDPDNKWVRFAVAVNRALWKYWDEDFLVLPYLHRSPLDAANGIRGTELFADLHEEPGRVQALIDWCADWSISLERHLAKAAPRPQRWGVGVWGCWLPDDAVFVNGDPVGLISRATAETFDRPSIEKLFTSTGGGFFHNHTVGLYQVDLVGSYRGAKVQWFVDDPRQPTLESALLDIPALRERILAASLECPIGGWVSCERLEELLDVARHGRFVLSLSCPEEVSVELMVRKVQAASRLR